VENNGTANVDPLVSLGLIDPRSVDSDPGSNGHQPAQQQQQQTQPAAGEGDPGQADPNQQQNWESDDNPYKTQLAQLRAQQVAGQIAPSSSYRPGWRKSTLPLPSSYRT
jgi:hypothetical protein